MSQPIVFVSHFRVKSGGMDDFGRLVEQVTQQLEADKPTAAFLNYLDPEASHLTIVHVFPDAQAMDSHFEGADERSRAAFEFISPLGWEIYGPASDAAIAEIREAAKAAGVDLTIAARYVAGFFRTVTSS